MSQRLFNQNFITLAVDGQPGRDSNDVAGTSGNCQAGYDAETMQIAVMAFEFFTNILLLKLEVFSSEEFTSEETVSDHFALVLMSATLDHRKLWDRLCRLSLRHRGALLHQLGQVKRCAWQRDPQLLVPHVPRGPRSIPR